MAYPKSKKKTEDLNLFYLKGPRVGSLGEPLQKQKF